MRSLKTPLFLLAGGALSLLGGCRGDLNEKAPLPSLDEAYFRCRVQPILTKSCGALTCHGDGKRYFHFFARNRLRLGGTEAERNAFLRDTERAYNLDAARALVDPEEPEESLLLKKPLAQDAGGFYHGAVLQGTSDVFATKDDKDYQTLLAWASGEKEDPTCVEPGSDF